MSRRTKKNPVPLLIPLFLGALGVGGAVVVAKKIKAKKAAAAAAGAAIPATGLPLPGGYADVPAPTASQSALQKLDPKAMLEQYQNAVPKDVRKQIESAGKDVGATVIKSVFGGETAKKVAKEAVKETTKEVTKTAGKEAVKAAAGVGAKEATGVAVTAGGAAVPGTGLSAGVLIPVIGTAVVLIAASAYAAAEAHSTQKARKHRHEVLKSAEQVVADTKKMIEQANELHDTNEKIKNQLLAIQAMGITIPGTIPGVSAFGGLTKPPVDYDELEKKMSHAGPFGG